ncbi:MAG: amidase [Alphaproteobacteria bacterium]|nr:amidase [Alphaproteobacteria bacterium]
MSDDLAFLSATELLSLYRRKALSPVEATKAIFARIRRYNDKINAFSLIDEKGALKAARASERRWAKGEAAGALDGVPLTIKEIVLTKGWPNRRGSTTIDPKGPWTEDAPCVARLREAGSVILGLTTTPEFGWKGVTDSPLTGITRNPWNLATTPGGSSGGASAALAAGMGALAIGTDGGGSIRIPSSFGGVFGLKPHFGRVPAYPLSAFGTVAHIGPMARTAADCALMLSVLSRPDNRDPLALPESGRDWLREIARPIADLRIAWSPTLGYAKVDKEVAAICRRAAARFAEMGARVDEVDDIMASPQRTFLTLWWSHAAKALAHLTPAQMKRVDPGLRRIVEKGKRIGLSAYLAAVQERGQLAVRMRRFHEEAGYDLLLTPQIAVKPFAAGRLVPEAKPKPDADWTDWTPFTYPFNLTQQPAMSVPCGFTADGLPVGLQIVGGWYQEHLVLRAAHAYQRAFPLTDRRPSLG